MTFTLQCPGAVRVSGVSSPHIHHLAKSLPLLSLGTTQKGWIFWERQRAARALSSGSWVRLVRRGKRNAFYIRTSKDTVLQKQQPPLFALVDGSILFINHVTTWQREIQEDCSGFDTHPKGCKSVRTSMRQRERKKVTLRVTAAPEWWGQVPLSWGPSGSHFKRPLPKRAAWRNAWALTKGESVWGRPWMMRHWPSVAATSWELRLGFTTQQAPRPPKAFQETSINFWARLQTPPPTCLSKALCSHS